MSRLVLLVTALALGSGVSLTKRLPLADTLTPSTCSAAVLLADTPAPRDKPQTGEIVVAPMPRDLRRIPTPRNWSRSVVTSVSDDSLSVHEVDGTTRSFERGPWVGTKYMRRGCKYHFADVRIGDVVCVGYDRVEGVNVALCVSIERRPWGKIPPVPHEDGPGGGTPWHVTRQAFQDHEELGRPLPAGLDPLSTEESARRLALVAEAIKRGLVVGNGIGLPNAAPIAPPPKLIDK